MVLVSNKDFHKNQNNQNLCDLEFFQEFWKFFFEKFHLKWQKITKLKTLDSWKVSRFREGLKSRVTSVTQTRILGLLVRLRFVLKLNPFRLNHDCCFEKPFWNNQFFFRRSLRIYENCILYISYDMLHIKCDNNNLNFDLDLLSSSSSGISSIVFNFVLSLIFILGL